MEQTPSTAEERLDEAAHEVLKCAKQEYKERKEYGELTDQERGWKLTQEEIVPAFDLGSQFLIHFRQRKSMWLWEFVRLVHWLFSLLSSERERLRLFLGIGTLLFCHTKEGEEHGWRPFSRPLDEILDDEIEQEVQLRVARAIRMYELERMVKELEKRGG